MSNSYFAILWLFVYTEALFIDTDIDYHIYILLVKVANTFFEVRGTLGILGLVFTSRLQSIAYR